MILRQGEIDLIGMAVLHSLIAVADPHLAVCRASDITQKTRQMTGLYWQAWHHLAWVKSKTPVGTRQWLSVHACISQCSEVTLLVNLAGQLSMQGIVLVTTSLLTSLAQGQADAWEH